MDMALLLMLVGYALVKFPMFKIGATTFLVLLLSILFFRSFLLDPSQFTDFSKVISAFLIFRLAFFNKDPQKTLKVIAFSYIIPVLVSLALAITGQGYIFWGDVETFVGPYYYKTDLAIMVVLASIFFRYFLFYSERKTFRRLSWLFIFAVSPFFIYLSNSRMLLVVYLFVFIFTALESLNYKKIRISRGIKSLFLLVATVIGFVGFNLFNATSSLGISLEIGNVFSAANTQGRNGIWESTLNNFYDGSIKDILFGYYLNADFDLNTYLRNDVHNTYLKVLVNTGIVGFIAYVLFCLRILGLNIKLWLKSGNDKNEKFLLNSILLVFVFYLLCGMTQSNIMFTQSSWYAFYFAGLLFNPLITLRSNNQYIEDEGVLYSK